jgi:predicted GNAT superfamily acetyltransferase
VSAAGGGGSADSLFIRPVSGLAEMRQAAILQERAGAWPDHLLPIVQQIASRDVGAILIGAFDGPDLVGFVYGFPGVYEGRSVLHSHMLTIDPRYRGRDLGYRLKRAQRRESLAKGLGEITWTFDPLRSANAYLNVTRLGAVVADYRVDYYGSDSTAPGARHIGTDRLWVRWPLDGERVLRRLAGERPPAGIVETAHPRVEHGSHGEPVSGALPQPARPVRIEIPRDIAALQRDRPETARAWRDCTRSAFLESLAAGYAVEDFVRLVPGGAAEDAGAYLLEAPDPSRARK